ncbi:hypothetical protein MmTuc01_0361 [Methanosarcina mazei Tuc01]|uniref:Uncharacterized protein n=1 Tax=Methanosarcina mazei Tuc01 TaxID=1236903 RepID=M1PUE2_METMZ|nr:hypothetical protein MmTuc01_0361 [Methanosarcina mazei Tuc01]
MYFQGDKQWKGKWLWLFSCKLFILSKLFGFKRFLKTLSLQNGQFKMF